MGEISSTTQTIKTGVPQGIHLYDTTVFCSLNPRDFNQIEDL